MYDSQESRQLLVEDGLIGAINTYSMNEVFLYPVIDNLILLLQQPLIVSFYHNAPSTNKPTFTTLLDPGLNKKLPKSHSRPDERRFMVPIPKSQFSACFQTIDTSEGLDNATVGALLPNELDQFKDIFDHLQLDDSLLGLKALYAIGGALESGSEGFNIRIGEDDRANKLLTETDAPTEDEINQMLEPMRRVITEAYADYRDSPLVSYLQGPKELPILNLFCVVRSSIDVLRNGLRARLFDYTARVMLSDLQKDQIAKHFRDDDGLSEHLEYPLGMRARSFADYVFASGVVDFSSEVPGQGRDKDSSRKDSPDWHRKMAERKVYGAITPGAKIFYIPIHIAGVPWLALFTLTPAPKNPKKVDPLSWAHNSLLYQILIPRIAERLRAGARLAYLQLIGRRFADALRESDHSTLIDRVNKAWKQVLRVYPHHGVCLAPANANCPHPLDLPDKRTVCLKLYENPYYSRKINYDLLNIQHVHDVCQRVLEEAHRKEVEIKSKFNETVLSQRHTIFNRTSLQHIKQALNRSSDELSGSARVIVDDVRRMTGVLETSLWIALRGGLSGNHPLREVRTVLQLLDWLRDHTPSFEIRPQLIIEDGVEDIPIKEGLLGDGFTVLWNLWHNASKEYGLYEPKEFQVRVAGHAEGLTITFINEGYDGLTQGCLNYLLHKAESPRENTGKGLKIVNQGLLNLGWSIDEAKIENDHTHIRVLVPH
jgi:hypothetical protein